MRNSTRYIYIAFGFLTVVLFLNNTFLIGFISDNICAKIYCMEPERLTMSSVIWIAMLPAVFTGPYFKRYLHAFFIFLMPYLFIATEARVYSGFVLDLQSLLAAYSLLFVFIVTLTLIYLHFVNLKTKSLKN